MLILFALRILKDGSVGQRKLKANQIYYLLQGFEIVADGKIFVDQYRLYDDTLYNDYFSADQSAKPKISISAIVGANGAGKSTLVELMLRLLNNFSAATIGEYTVNPSAEHLHFINGIQAELYYLKDGVPYRLKVVNRNVSLESYSADQSINNPGKISFTPYNTPDVFDNEMSIEPQSESLTPIQPWNPGNISKKEKSSNPLKEIYEHIFYTHVSNYSIYAYNSDDYHMESNDNRYEAKARQRRYGNYSVEERNWLKGLFHKNDGYQTPIVLSPMRTRGNTDINTENKLSKERLLSLLITPDTQFRVINGHLTVTGFGLTLKRTTYNAKYLNANLGFIRLRQRGYEEFERLLTLYWGEVISENLKSYASKRRNYQQAIGYLVYKTLKISSKYKQYNDFFRHHEGISYRIDEKALRKLVGELSTDHSHITRKIRQILAYIVYGTYPSEQNSFAVDIEYATNTAKEIVEKEGTKEGNKIVYFTDDLVPPPIYDVTIQLEDLHTQQTVFFETLSSGERQQAYSISSMLYHLANLESVWQDNNHQRIAYSHAQIVLEEVELYFHPDLQRTFVKNILDGLKQCNLPHIKSIHFCFVTHSPFVLSDIPGRNILTLSKDGESIESSGTLSSFGANIHDMLRQQFFLCNGSIGAYAQWMINRIINDMEECKQGEKQINSVGLHSLIMLIDEPIIRNALLKEFRTVFEDKTNEMKMAEIDREITDLKQKRHLLCGN